MCDYIPEEKLNPTFKEAWVRALRSGAYTQGHARLRSIVEEYCCLGVALAVKGIAPDTHPHPLDGGEYTWNGRGGLPDRETLAQLGLSSSTAGVLANMNDNPNDLFPFPMIADWIQENL